MDYCFHPFITQSLEIQYARVRMKMPKVPSLTVEESEFKRAPIALSGDDRGRKGLSIQQDLVPL